MAKMETRTLRETRELALENFDDSLTQQEKYFSYTISKFLLLKEKIIRKDIERELKFFDIKKDKVELEGNAVNLPSNYVYYKLNKPKGYMCTSCDDRGRKTIFDLVKSDVRLFSIGRLDYDTEGLIILTNDGDTAQKLGHPSHETEKEYIVKIEGQIKESELAVLRAGVIENGERMPKAKVKLLSTVENNARISVIIHEGQNHQVRRMFDAIGKSIIMLKRVRVGNIKLGGLKRGEYKKLSDLELLSILGE